MNNTILRLQQHSQEQKIAKNWHKSLKKGVEIEEVRFVSRGELCGDRKHQGL